MRRSRLSEEQIVQILKAAEAGVGADEICRKHGISRGTFYRWRAGSRAIPVALRTGGGS